MLFETLVAALRRLGLGFAEGLEHRKPLLLHLGLHSRVLVALVEGLGLLLQLLLLLGLRGLQRLAEESLSLPVLEPLVPRFGSLAAGPT